jgi:phospholipase/carboxylesterase
MSLHFIHKPASQHTLDNPTIVMLHGRGADEGDLFGFSQRLDERFSIYSLRAPYDYEWGGFSWFELFDDGSVDEESFQKSRAEILNFISGIKSQKIFLFGFSMGTIMSYAIGLTEPSICSGMVCMSGFAPLQIEKEYRLTELQHLHIFASHGITDQVIPVASARETQELLRRSNAVVTYKEYRMGHEISEECFADVSGWLIQQL